MLYWIFRLVLTIDEYRDNYANFGCDIGGYRGDSGDEHKDAFVRWAQFGAFIPLMENGGGGEHRPWMYDDETVDIYRKFVLEHYRLIPYWMITGMESMESGGQKSALKPIAVKPEDAEDYENPQPSTYSYLIGDDLLVHPVVNELSIVDMTFPAGENDVWLNWWNPIDMSSAVSGKDSEYTFVQKIPFDSYPVYVKKNAFVPLQENIEDGTVMFTWFCPDALESNEINTKGTVVREPSSVGTGMKATVSLQEGVFSGSISAHAGYPAGFSVVGVSDATSLSITPEGACDRTYVDETKTLTISCADTSLGVVVSAAGVNPLF